MTKIAIIGAIDPELKALIGKLTEHKEVKVGHFIFIEGKLLGKDIIIAKCGVGKVSSAMITQKIIDEFQPQAIIMTGSCGALKEDLRIGDIVVSRDVLQHDMDVTALGFKRGEIPFAETSIFNADVKLRELALEVKIENQKIVSGRILSGDQFYTKEQTLARTYLFDELKGDVQEMEGAAAAQVCTFNNVPFVILRIVDSELYGTQEGQYQETSDRVVSNSLPLIEHIVESY